MLDFYDESAKVHTKKLIKKAQNIGVQVDPEFAEKFQKAVAREQRNNFAKRSKKAKEQEERDSNRLLIRKAV
jgi:hypothetical protein